VGRGSKLVLLYQIYFNLGTIKWNLESKLGKLIETLLVVAGKGS
jgi:hypothetical protein